MSKTMEVTEDMSTFLPKADEIKRSWYILDAANKPLGRTAATAAVLLRGKHKPVFTPNVDCGDHVIIINAEQAVLTGNKLENKYYRHHTGWIGNMKEVKYATLMKNNPEKAMMLAIKGMIPDNTLGRTALTRVRIYKGAEHKHEAQQPTPWNE
jgi:large subunit ribosomal protein L13